MSPASGDPTEAEGPTFTETQRQSWLDEARTALQDLPQQAASLRRGMAAFQPGFDQRDWREAFDAPVPERNRCDTALLAFVLGVGELNTAIQTGTVLDGLIGPALRKTQAPNHYKALEQAKILSPAERRALNTVNRTRNGVAHIYGEVTADEVHEAIEAFEGLLGSDLMGRLRDWLVRLGL